MVVCRKAGFAKKKKKKEKEITQLQDKSLFIEVIKFFTLLYMKSVIAMFMQVKVGMQPV